MTGFPDDEPACWSWPLPSSMTREDEIERLAEENLRLVRDHGNEHLLPESALRMLTRDWPTYLLSSWHNERCALCGNHGGHLVVDHDHSSGLVRGRLCRGCNISEGARAVDEAVAYALYRRRPPAVILGLTVYYVGRGWEDGWWHDVGQARALTGNTSWARVA